jgi:FkbM family methyltransferase
MKRRAGLWLGSSLVRVGGWILRRASREIAAATPVHRGARSTDVAREATREVWIDVGSHLGETTYDHARQDPNLIVYAFEPNSSLAVQRVGLLPNYVVLPMAVSEQDGIRPFFLNSDDATSSLLAFNPEGWQNWRWEKEVQTTNIIWVPTIRLDTFFCHMGIRKVSYLKIDAQGHDLAVVRSLGNRLADVERVRLEVAINSVPLYEGANSKPEVVEYMEKGGFMLVGANSQSHGQELNLTFQKKHA